MNVTTGQYFPLQYAAERAEMAALQAAEPGWVEVRGAEADVAALSRSVRASAADADRRRKRRKQQRAARRAGR